MMDLFCGCLCEFRFNQTCCICFVGVCVSSDSIRHVASVLWMTCSRGAFACHSRVKDVCDGCLPML